MVIRMPMTLSNAIAANLPICAGNVVAWNTRWLTLNTDTGFTNDYRILIVSSQMSRRWWLRFRI